MLPTNPKKKDVKEIRNAYLEDMVTIFSHMKRFQKAVTNARIEWKIPGGLSYAKRAAWYQSFFLKPDGV